MAATITEPEPTISTPDDARSLEEVSTSVAGMSDTELRARLVASVRERARYEAEEALWYAEAERRRLHTHSGQRSLPIMLAADTKHSDKTFGRRRRRAQRLTTDFAHVHQALFDGRIGVDHATRIFRTANLPRLYELAVHAQGGFIDWAMFEDWGTFTRYMDAWAEVVDPADPQELEERRWERRGFAFTEFDGTVMIQIDTTTMAFAQFQAAAQPLVDKMFAQDWAEAKARVGPGATPSDITRTDSQRWHDAWIQLARAGHGADIPGTNFVVNIVQDQHTFDAELGDHLDRIDAAAHDQPAPQRPVLTTDEAIQRATTYRSHTLTGHTISRGLTLRAAIIGHLKHWRINQPTHDFTATKTARYFTGAKRIGLIIRDPHCTTPGCTTLSHRCDMDHTVPHQHGGPTTPPNGQPKCKPCHRHKTMLETLGYL